jgi:hypothetical protein
VTEKTANILEGYVEESRFASDNGICLRTSARYRSLPDGLPFLPWGGKILIPIEVAKEWLRSRVKRRNATRRAA